METYQFTVRFLINLKIKKLHVFSSMAWNPANMWLTKTCTFLVKNYEKKSQKLADEKCSKIDRTCDKWKDLKPE